MRTRGVHTDCRGGEGASAASRGTAATTLHASTPWGADLVSCSPLQLSTNSLGHKYTNVKEV